ncbi:MULTISPECIES: DUF3144 domain-containing protein [unclassified Janthinobacterium]|uniref:DUF3144 domain-containing protein n=1 Tax=unclassified Janthinobacterium TaxID=2610881 RepID=UPI0016081650|nr:MULTISPECIES: DUF3144 domain-containing protein [unclassified Janthinobacterium]MBB5366827.1 putative oxidoreductase (fatty acid repression mutant protein) [Janthinobacterium sp. K2C7]MBB5380695.1 putative oxidoreductase (fatty acid repression mutant protein) [Janthinobacterium sp. K2Li3]MBB5385209.1 putative oxidoreductase (fatty acid repression mutant protein) [Janthinobacterium sp. K2E3]
MSTPKTAPEFWERADQIIAVANQQCEHSNGGEVATSLLYAAARFNAFLVASKTNDPVKMQQEKEEAVAFFTEQYKRMLNDNFNDYIANFAKYTDPAAAPKA